MPPERALPYQIHGLNLRSALPLPGRLQPDADPVDALIELGSVEPVLDGTTYAGPLIQVAPGKLQLFLPGLARYRVTRDLVVIDPLAEAERSLTPLEGGPSADDLTVFLLNRALPALMLLRGYLPLEATAVQVSGGAALLCGNTARGKSVLAATLHGRGQAILSDGICYLATGDEGVVLLPGLPFFCLWSDAMDALGVPLDPARRLRQGVGAPRIYRVDMPEFEPRSTPVRRVVILPGVAAPPMTDPVTTLLSYTVMNHFVDPLGGGPSAHELARATCAQCPVLAWQPAVPLKGGPVWGALTRQSLDSLADEFGDICG